MPMMIVTKFAREALEAHARQTAVDVAPFRSRNAALQSRPTGTDACAPHVHA
jgi:hypothetical protein